MITVIKFFNDGIVNSLTFLAYLSYAKEEGLIDEAQEEILYALYRHNRRDRFTQKKLVERLKSGGILVDSRGIREAIANLRLMGAMIASGNDGFWRAETREEMKKTIESQYTKQALDMLWKARVIRDHTIAQFGGQQVLDFETERLLDEMAYTNPEDMG